MNRLYRVNLTRIGNSRGVRLPVGLIRKLGLEGGLVMEDRGDELVIRACKGKLSWAETAREMAAAGEDWAEWDAALADGLEDAPWVGDAPAAPGPQPARPGRKRAGRKAKP
jgi:antitoxin component of MazEF toxin-antitoxin module